MILYEVNLDVDVAIAEAFEAWLVPHVEEIVALEGVVGARWYRVDAELGAGPMAGSAGPAGGGVSGAAAPNARVRWSAHYLMRDRAAYDTYIERHAPRLRADGLSRFGGRFSATRRVMELAGERVRA